MYRAKRNAFVFALIVAFGGFIFGLDIALISGTFKYITAEFGLSAFQKGNIAGAPGWGALIALVCAGYFSDKFGRKNTLLIIAALYVVSAIGSAFAPSYETLFAARFLGGLAFTSLTLASMYIGEIAPPSLRGKLVGLNQMNIVIGIFVAQLLNFYIVKVTDDNAEWAVNIGLVAETSWRWMLGLEIIPAVIWFLALMLVPESPRWLILNGKLDKAEYVISRITPNTRVKEQFNQIIDNLKDTGHAISLVAQFKLLMTPSMRIALLIGLAVALVQPLTGMNAVLAFMPMIFAQVGGGDDVAFLQTVWVGAAGMVFTALALVMIDRLGRRPILLGGLIWGSISMGLVTYGFYNASYMISLDSLMNLAKVVDIDLLKPLVGIEYASDLDFKHAVVNLIGQESFVVAESELLNAAANMNGMLVLVGIISFVASYNFSIGPVLWILFSEIFTTKVRAVAIPMCAFITSVFGGVVVPTFFPWQLENLGATTTFLIYTGLCLLGLMLLASIVPETKNKTLEEIEVELTKRSLNR